MLSNKSEYQILFNCVKELESTSADIERAALITGDGTPLYTGFRSGADEEAIKRSAALLAAGSTLAVSLVDELSSQKLQHLYFECQNGYIILVPLYSGIVLIVLAGRRATVSLIVMEIKRIFMSRTLIPIMLSSPLGHLRSGVDPEYDDLP